jgi:hypothetical protein
LDRLLTIPGWDPNRRVTALAMCNQRIVAGYHCNSRADGLRVFDSASGELLCAMRAHDLPPLRFGCGADGPVAIDPEENDHDEEVGSVECFDLGGTSYLASVSRRDTVKVGEVFVYQP